MGIKKSILLCGTLIFSLILKSQDPHFSQFFASPLTLNPAFTGKFDGQLRLAVNHRDQWPSIPKAYVTSSASLDMPILQNKIAENDVLGIGISGVSDQSADNALKLNYGSISISYHKALDEDGFNTIGVGFQGTYSDILLDMSKLKFEDQISADGFTNPTSEVLTNGNNQHYFDVNAGLLYSGSTDGYNNYYFGVSMYHINGPTVGFIDKYWKISPRYTIHGGASLPVNDKIFFYTSAIEQVQNKATETSIGAALSFSIGGTTDNPSNLYAGSWVRVKDAIIPYVGLEFNGIKIGASYDVNTSSLKAASQSKGGSEISLIYIKPYPNKDKGVPCPRF